MLHLGHRDGLQAALSRRSDASGPAVEAAEVPAAPLSLLWLALSCKCCVGLAFRLGSCTSEDSRRSWCHAWACLSLTSARSAVLGSFLEPVLLMDVSPQQLTR